LTLDQLWRLVSEEAAERTRQRRLLIELGELAQQTRLRHLSLFPANEPQLQVASLYLVHLFKSLPQRERATFYRAAYPFFISTHGQKDLERLILNGQINKFFVSLEAFQFLAFFGEALLPPTDEKAPGYWNRTVIQSITKSSLKLLSAHYLLSPAAFARRLSKLSEEAGNAFAMTLTRDEKDHLEYLYEHVPEALAALARLFPRDIAEFTLRENALFTARFLRQLYPEVEASFVVIPRKTRDGRDIMSPRARLLFPKSSPLRSFVMLGHNLAGYLRNRMHGDKGEKDLVSEGVLVDEQAKGSFSRMVPLWRNHRARLYSSFNARGRHEVYFDLPPACTLDGVGKNTTSVFETIEEHAHLKIAREAKNMRRELLETSLQISDGLLGYLSFRSLDSLIRSGHAFLREYDPDDTFHGHSHRVGVILARLTALYPDLIQPSIQRVYALGLLHDLGKLSIPPAVLTKPGRLDETEWMFIRLHPLTGALLFAPCVEDRGHLMCAQIAFANLFHHENWAGGGYPYGLTVRDSPRFALEEMLAAEASSTKFLVKLLRIADSLDAMISKALQPKPGERSYHVTIAEDTSLDNLIDFATRDLRSRAGDWYDPQLIERLGKGIVGELVVAYTRLRDTRGVLIPRGLNEIPGGEPLIRILEEVVAV